MSLSASPVASGTSVFRRNTKHLLLFIRQHQWPAGCGLAKLATLSDGAVFEPVNSFKKNQKKLARLQRQLSRKVKFSNNWQEHKIQRLHSCIANIRRDSLHKVTTSISKSHAMIVIEDWSATCQSQQRVQSTRRGAMSGQNQV